MPSGYTANIKDGITFEQFAMNCARAFGACIELRDEGGDGSNIPEKFTASPYHKEHLEESQQKLKDFLTLTTKDLEQLAQAKYEQDIVSYKERVKEDLDLLANYEYMLEKANQWQIPSDDHAKLKEFMIQQITDSIKWDCNNTREEPTLEDAETYFQRKVKQLKRNVAYHQEQMLEEELKCAKNTLWITQLRNSLEK